MEENKRLTLKTKSKDTIQNYKQKSLFEAQGKPEQKT